MVPRPDFLDSVVVFRLCDNDYASPIQQPNALLLLRYAVTLICLDLSEARVVELVVHVDTMFDCASRVPCFGRWRYIAEGC